MGSRWRIGITTIGIFAWYFWPVADERSEPARKISHTNRIPSAKPIVASRKPADVAPLAPTVTKKHETQHLDQCWDKISKQTQETPEFKQRLSAEIGDMVEPWFYRANTEEPATPLLTAPNLFFLGLAKAGLLGGRANIQQSDELAVRYLYEAHKLDSRNSAPLLYGAYVAARMNDQRRAHIFLKLLNQRATRFDSYVTQIVRGIYSSIENTADLVNGVTIWSSLPMPSYGELVPWLKEPHFERFARQMLREGLSRPDPYEGLDYIAIEYGVARSSIKDPSLPTLKEIWDRNPPGQDAGELQDALEATCDLQTLDPFLAKMKRRLARE